MGFWFTVKGFIGRWWSSSRTRSMKRLYMKQFNAIIFLINFPTILNSVMLNSAGYFFSMQIYSFQKSLLLFVYILYSFVIKKNHCTSLSVWRSKNLLWKNIYFLIPLREIWLRHNHWVLRFYIFQIFNADTKFVGDFGKTL